MSSIQDGYEILSDGRTVWVNDSFINVGRFSRNGIDIHHRAEEQILSGKQCLDCKAGPCTDADWDHFQKGMMFHFGVLIGDEHKPKNLAPAKKLELV